ncbi:catechol 2,3-dioxygenase-like lactoylglutathione lyase family enzyme [Actinokineospora baliensis]|uniref:VOC family protein n=1 Tax=Actinokineospora baliensis TaxID=547056 RepID=UPI0019588396|nr:VOC family protein [Actinokineospora baliensis]MBM7772245.1 catechol 2,3-dioxygenase-like lactoylglutathione lyase family enzyme [Actinokineospora baliensis]
MDWKLQVVVVPVADVDRAKEFYAGKLGFAVDTDFSPNEHFRVVQVTPPGSACSITFGKGVGGGEPGSVKGCHLVVTDILAAEKQLDAAGVEHSGTQHFVDGVMTPGVDPEGRDFGSFLFFSDPDGNSWAVQQVAAR